MFSFEDNNLIISFEVLNELDSKKNSEGSVGRNSREATRLLLELIGSPNMTFLPADKFSGESVDDYLIRLAIEQDAILITNDNNLILKATCCGAQAELYYNDFIEEVYTGHSRIAVPGELIDSIYKNSFDKFPIDFEGELYPNHYLTLYNEYNEKQSALCVVDKQVKTFSLINQHKSIMGLQPLNSEQKFALDALLNPEIELVIITGDTGSGKTLLSLACGIEQVYRQVYESVIVVRKEVGVSGEKTPWLPGGLDDKLSPWLSGVHCCLNHIAKKEPNFVGNVSEYDNPYEYYLKTRIVEPKSLDYVRGTTFNSFILLEEAQNFIASDLKTLVTRAGKPSKVVITGDLQQIDCRYLNEFNNGLIVSVDAWKDSKRSACIHLSKTTRSELAEEAYWRYK